MPMTMMDTNEVDPIEVRNWWWAKKRTRPKDQHLLFSRGGDHGPKEKEKGRLGTHKYDKLLPGGQGGEEDRVQAGDGHRRRAHEQGIDVGDLVLGRGPVRRVKDARKDQRRKGKDEEVDAVKVEVGGFVQEGRDGAGVVVDVVEAGDFRDGAFGGVFDVGQGAVEVTFGVGQFPFERGQGRAVSQRGGFIGIVIVGMSVVVMVMHGGASFNVSQGTRGGATTMMMMTGGEPRRRVMMLLLLVVVLRRSDSGPKIMMMMMTTMVSKDTHH